MNINEFFRRLQDGVMHNYFQFEINIYAQVRVVGEVRPSTCPLCAVAGIKGCDYVEAATILGLRRDSADKIAFAADKENSFFRKRLLKVCGL